MATAEELLGTITEVTDDILVVDLNTRIISIPATIKVLGVESDDDVKRLHFRVPRYYGEFDLSAFDIRINYKNAAGDSDLYPADDVAVSDDGNTFSFSWLVDRVAFVRKGDVQFSLCMKLYENGVVVKEFNTAKATLPVLEGLETERAVVEENPSAFDAVLCRLYAVEAATGLGAQGYYSIAKVEETDGGVLVTIINQDGQTQAVIKDGPKPVKGVDYWTAEDQAELTSEVNKYITSWCPDAMIVTLLASQWTDNKQTVSVTGMTADSIVVVAPDPANDNFTAYTEAGVRCIAQAVNELAFECNEVPAVDLVVNIAVYRSANTVEGAGVVVVSDDDNGNVVLG